MYDERNDSARATAEEVRSRFPYYVYETVIPRTRALADAPRSGRPIVLFHPMSQGAQAYERLAREILGQEERRISE